jgi:hypothetical protein
MVLYGQYERECARVTHRNNRPIDDDECAIVETTKNTKTKRKLWYAPPPGRPVVRYWFVTTRKWGMQALHSTRPGLAGGISYIYFVAINFFCFFFVLF